MMELYFNHSPLECATETVALALIKEIVMLSGIAVSEQTTCKFYNTLWNTKLANSKTLQQFLYQLPKESDILSIMHFVDSGPHYSFKGFIHGATIQPSVLSGTFGEQLLHICFSDSCKSIVSLQNESVLTQQLYQVDTTTTSHQVSNQIGDAALRDFFNRSRQFRSIHDVFEEIENRTLESLVLLTGAKKSARSHNFLGYFSEIHAALLALHSVELPLVLEDASETVRVRVFRETTGLEISREHPTTMQDPLYRNQRLFKIPSYSEKQLFEWHIKIGNHTRIHYFVDKPNGKVYVGHCGKHLGVSSYHS